MLFPLGLHFRTREYFRTDVWVEYGEPIQVESSEVPQNLVDAVSSGTWSEPPAESVFRLRDKLREDLVPLSPNTHTWKEYRALLLLGHINGRIINQHQKPGEKKSHRHVISGINIVLNQQSWMLIIYSLKRYLTL